MLIRWRGAGYRRCDLDVANGRGEVGRSGNAIYDFLCGSVSTCTTCVLCTTGYCCYLKLVPVFHVVDLCTELLYRCWMESMNIEIGYRYSILRFVFPFITFWKNVYGISHTWSELRKIKEYFKFSVLERSEFQPGSHNKSVIENLLLLPFHLILGLRRFSIKLMMDKNTEFQI